MERPQGPGASDKKENVVDFAAAKRRQEGSDLEAEIGAALQAELQELGRHNSKSREQNSYSEKPDQDRLVERYKKEADIEEKSDKIRDNISKTYRRFKETLFTGGPLAGAIGIGAGLWEGAQAYGTSDPAQAENFLNTSHIAVESGLGVFAAAMLLQGLNLAVRKLRENKAYAKRRGELNALKN